MQNCHNFVFKRRNGQKELIKESKNATGICPSHPYSDESYSDYTRIVTVGAQPISMDNDGKYDRLIVTIPV